MKIDLDELERIARAADHDEWQWTPDDVLQGKHDAQVVMYAEWYNDGTAGIFCSVANRAHIAASSPPVTLALVARIRELEEALGARLAAPGGFDEAGERLLRKGVVLP